MSAKQLFQKLFLEISLFENTTEATSISYIILEELFELNRIDVLMDKPIQLTDIQNEEISRIIKRLKSKEPIQHIFGHVEFYGRKFLVNKNVLIPRPETEELVDLVLKQHPNMDDMKVLDIGTGSGIIPITIKKERSAAQVFAVDISEAALATAKRNAALNNASIEFSQLDILNEPLSFLAPLDIIISNPPYVTDKEKLEMDKKVLEYDPDHALFVPDNDPLLFYTRITILARQTLNKKGFLYFEINEQFGEATKRLISKNNFEKITIIKDMQGKDRFIAAQLT